MEIDLPTPYISYPARNIRSISPSSPIILTKVPDLKEISAVTVAVGIWNHVNIPQALWKAGLGGIKPNTLVANYPHFRQIAYNICKSTVELSVPKSIADYIVEYVKKIRYQIQDWVAYHRQAIFFGDGGDFHLYHHIPYFKWYPDGTINYKETARNLLTSHRLSDIEKYKFLCTYCLEDELIQLVPSLLTDNVVEFADSSTHPLIFYWNHYFRNTLHAIPFTTFASLDNYMFQHQRVDNWWAKEYFLDRLDSEEKVQGAITLIDKFGVWYQKLILLKLNDTERVNLYMQRAEQILSNYLRTGICTREILSTWYDVRDLINPDQFALIFENLLNSQNKDAIAIDIWASACDDFKYHISTYKDCQIIGKIFQLQMKNIDDNEFLFTVLSDINADIKKKISKMRFFTDYCDALLLQSKLSIFEQLIKKCLPIEELEQFKQEFILASISIKDECSSYYLSERVESVNNLLTELLPSRPDLVQEYKKKLFLLHDNILRSVNNYGISPSQLDAIMADSLPTDDLKTNFKQRIVFSPIAISTLQSKLTDGDQFLLVKENLGYYFTSDEHRKQFKRRLITNFENKLALMFMKYDVSLINSILRWCLEDDQGLLEYKSTLYVDTIFTTLLTNAFFLRYDRYRLTGCTFRKKVEFVYVDMFLNWYFETPGKVKQYKLLKINSYHNISMINTLLRKKDESHLKILMRWFFGHDHVEMEKFKKRYNGAGKITYVLMSMI